MKRIISLAFTMMLFISLCGFTTINKQEQLDFARCEVKITRTNPQTGQTFSEYYYSDSRTSLSDCAQGARDLANERFFTSSDFKRSLTIFEWDMK